MLSSSRRTPSVPLCGQHRTQPGGSRETDNKEEVTTPCLSASSPLYLRTPKRAVYLRHLLIHHLALSPHSCGGETGAHSGHPGARATWGDVGGRLATGDRFRGPYQSSSGQASKQETLDKILPFLHCHPQIVPQANSIRQPHQEAGRCGGCAPSPSRLTVLQKWWPSSRPCNYQIYRKMAIPNSAFPSPREQGTSPA